MKRGALSVDQEVLTQLGCFDRRVNGAGTVAAAASIFLASRYAADPLHGLIEAAFAYGADTDTIASMTGGILGAVAGIEWLGNHVEHIQDAQFLKVLGEWLVSNRDIDRNRFENILQTTRKDLDSLLEKLGVSNPKDIISLPNGMEVKVSAPQLHQARSKTIQVISWRLTANEGQSLYIKKIYRNRSRSDLNRGTLYNTLSASRLEVDLQSVEVVKSGVQLLVRDMEKARFFYEKALGLKVEKVSRTSVNLGGNIALVSSDYKKSIVQQPKRVSSNWNSIVYLEIHPLEAAYNNVCQLGAPIQIPISQTQASGQRFFRCFDPDGNLVEIFEKSERCIERGDAGTV